MKTRGFTLIELLIVVAIIAILAVMVGNGIYDMNHPCKRGHQETHQVCIDDNPNHRGHYCDEYAFRPVFVCDER